MSRTFLRYFAATALALPLLALSPRVVEPAQGAAPKAVTAQATVVLNVTGMT